MSCCCTLNPLQSGVQNADQGCDACFLAAGCKGGCASCSQSQGKWHCADERWYIPISPFHLLISALLPKVTEQLSDLPLGLLTVLQSALARNVEGTFIARHASLYTPQVDVVHHTMPRKHWCGKCVPQQSIAFDCRFETLMS